MQAIQTKETKKESADAWKARALLGILGQVVMLTGTAMERAHKGEGGLDIGDLGFAASNLLANCIALRYGASHSNDEDQLSFVTMEIDRALAPYIPHDLQTVLAPSQDKTENKRNPIDQFLYDHASRISIGMRYLALGSKLLDGINTGNLSKINGMAIAAIGKTIGLTQYTQSPFDEHEPTTLEALRQHSFTTGAMIESAVYGSYGLKMLEAYEQKQEAWQLVKTLAYGVYVSSFIARMSASLDTFELDDQAVANHLAVRINEVPEERRQEALTALQNHLLTLPEMQNIDMDVDKMMNSLSARAQFAPNVITSDHVPMNRIDRAHVRQEELAIA